MLAARIERLFNDASVAGYVAAPPEPALAVDLLLDDPRVVAPSAAEQLAAVDTLRRRVALSALCAQCAGLTIRPAKVRRILAVDEVEATRRFDRQTLGDEAVTVVARYDLGRSIERLLQPVAHLAERRHLAPAGAHCTRARETVALALGAHEVSHCLFEKKESFSYANFVWCTFTLYML